MTRSFNMLWDILLEFRKQFAKNSSGTELVSAVIAQDGFHVFAGKVPSINLEQCALCVCLKKPVYCEGAITVFFVNDELTVKILQEGSLNKEEIEFMSCFLPFCIMPNLAFKLNRAISVMHLAQSIDGRIATMSYNSKWISKSENLIYVHRMRALSDGILIGSHTLQNDKPALTVRHVTGPNPVKIILGNSAVNFDSILESKDRIIRLVTRSGLYADNIETICLHETSGIIHPIAILEELYKHGINSVFIEGGSFTTSFFIQEKAIDLMNFYIAPVILGSGISIEFQGIVRVEDALSLQNCRYMPMGDGMLITGHIKNIRS